MNVIQNSPLVSVIITGKNEEKIISKCVKSILNQTYNNFEFIYVDAYSSDKTYDIVKKFEKELNNFSNCKNFIIISDKADNPAKGRNLGVSKSNGEILIFTDADCIAEKDWLENIIPFVTENNMIGGPNIQKHFVNNTLVKSIDYVLQSKIGSGGSAQFQKINSFSKVNAIPGCNMAITKKMFNEIGGFNEKLRYNEDSELCLKVLKHNYEILYNPKAKVNHFMGIDSFSDFIKMIYTYGKERGKNARYNNIPLSRFNKISIVLGLIFLGTLFGSNFIFELKFVIAGIISTFLFFFFSLSFQIFLKSRSLKIGIISFPLLVSELFIYNIGIQKGFFKNT